MEERNLSGLIELLFVIGLVGWFSYSQLRSVRKDKRLTDGEDRAAESKERPPRDAG